MEHRDLFLDEIKQLEKLFSYILANIINPKETVSVYKLETQLEKQLGIKIHSLLNLDSVSFLKNILKFRMGDKNLEKFSDVLFALAQEANAENNNQAKQKLCLEKSIAILEYLMDNCENYSFLWETKIQNHKSLLSRYT